MSNARLKTELRNWRCLLNDTHTHLHKLAMTFNTRAARTQIHTKVKLLKALLSMGIVFETK